MDKNDYEFSNMTIGIEDAARFLGFRNVERLRKKARDGIIPGFKAGKHWMFLKDRLIEYVNELTNENMKPKKHKEEL